MSTGTGKYERLLERCQGLSPVPTAVAWPGDKSSLAGAMDAAAKHPANEGLFYVDDHR